MVQTPAEAQGILERCITENSDEAWAAFLCAFGPLIRRVYHAHASATSFSEFESWFPGWLFYERKLHAAYRGLQAKVHSGECSTVDSQAQYLCNYIATIIRAAVAEFVKDQRLKVGVQVPDTVLAGFPGSSPGVGEELYHELLEALAQLSPELRVPFWLRYYLAMGPLSSSDTAWVAERLGWSPERVTETVASEADSKAGHQKPIRSEFIGLMLGIPPCVDGRYSTVDQRVRRAIVRVREYLAQTSKEGEE